MSATPDRAQGETGPKPDSLRSTRAGAIWTALPARDQHLLLWLLSGDIVTAQLATLLVYGLLDPLSGWAPAHRWGIVRELSAPDAAVTAHSCVASAVSPPTAGPADTLPTELLRLRSVETELTHRESTTTHRA